MSQLCCRLQSLDPHKCEASLECAQLPRRTRRSRSSFEWGLVHCAMPGRAEVCVAKIALRHGGHFNRDVTLPSLNFFKARGWCQPPWLGFGESWQATSQKSTSMTRQQNGAGRGAIYRSWEIGRWQVHCIDQSPWLGNGKVQEVCLLLFLECHFHGCALGYNLNVNPVLGINAKMRFLAQTKGRRERERKRKGKGERFPFSFPFPFLFLSLRPFVCAKNRIFAFIPNPVLKRTYFPGLNQRGRPY